MARPNQWVDFIRKWAKENDTTYSCALSNPKCKDAYRAKYGIRKAVPAKTERERMGLEDVNVGKKAAPSRTSYYQEWRDNNKEAAKIARQQRENRLMGSEDVNVGKKKKVKKVKKKKNVELVIEDDLELAERGQMGSEDVNRAEPEPDRVKRLTWLDGKKYLISKKTGVIYNLDQDVVGKMNFIKNRIDFISKSDNDAETERIKNAEEDVYTRGNLSQYRNVSKRMKEGTAKELNQTEGKITGNADEIANTIYLEIPRPGISESDKINVRMRVKEIEDIIDNSYKAKKINKREASTLKGKKMLGFIKKLVGESEGGKKGLSAAWRSTKKGIDKGLTKTANVLNMINPVYQMNTRAPEVGEVMGNLSYNYALPAMVSMGYYAYIAAAEGAATMMGLPPQVGKEAAEILWDEMVVKPGYDPRERQKSKAVGTSADMMGRIYFGGGSFYRL